MKLSVGEVLGDAWNLYSRHAGKLILMAAMVFALLSLVAAAVSASDSPGLIAVSVVVNTVGLLWLQGALAIAVSDLRAGRKLGSVIAMFARVEPRLWPVIGAGILLAIAVQGGLILLIVPGLIVMTFTMATMPAVVLEGKGVIAAIRRSYQLVKGDGWRVFAIIAITTLFAAIIAIVISTIFVPLPEYVDLYLASVVANSVVMPLVALAWTLTYFDLKLNKDTQWTTT